VDTKVYMTIFDGKIIENTRACPQLSQIVAAAR
jgi:hypothetical protein